MHVLNIYDKNNSDTFRGTKTKKCVMSMATDLCSR